MTDESLPCCRGEGECRAPADIGPCDPLPRQSPPPADERRDALAEVLGAHDFDIISAECSCGGWVADRGPRMTVATYEQHRAHVARALLASDAFAEVIRAERASALREAADRMPAFHDRDVPEWAITSACKWLRDRADREAQR